MVRTGTYDGVPLYSRTTIEPNSVVYVPLSGGRMQPYERRRDGQLAGTVGSYTPSFPVATSRDILIGAPAVVPMAEAPAPPMLESPQMVASAPRPVPATPTFSPMILSLGEAETTTQVTKPMRLTRQPIERREGSPNGVFIEFDGARWFSSGLPAALDAARFTRIGELHGFPIYSARDGNSSTIYMPVGRDMELVSPYTRRKQADPAVK
jgi:hypothetical protein